MTVHSTARRLWAADLAGALAFRIGELARELTGTEPTSRSAGVLRFRSRGSLSVCAEGAKRGSWYDHEAGVGGDALDLVAHLRGTDLATAIMWAAGWLGAAPARPPPPRPAPTRPADSRNTDTARRLWCEAVQPAGSPVESYLRTRNLGLQDHAPIRFHPACPRGAERLPAMLALMTDPATGEPCGLHRTFLAPDGSGKAPRGLDGEGAKMMLGGAGVIRLSPDHDVTLGLGLCEGIETGLALLQHFRWAPVWAAASAGAIHRFPLLCGIESLTVFADADAAGLAAARACKARWMEAGKEAHVVWPGEAGRDFADRAA